MPLRKNFEESDRDRDLATQFMKGVACGASRAPRAGGASSSFSVSARSALAPGARKACQSHARHRDDLAVLDDQITIVFEAQTQIQKLTEQAHAIFQRSTRGHAPQDAATQEISKKAIETATLQPSS